jgi:hypothetical protein
LRYVVSKLRDVIKKYRVTCGAIRLFQCDVKYLQTLIPEQKGTLRTGVMVLLKYDNGRRVAATVTTNISHSLRCQELFLILENIFDPTFLLKDWS